MAKVKVVKSPFLSLSCLGHQRTPCILNSGTSTSGCQVSCPLALGRVTICLLNSEALGIEQNFTARILGSPASGQPMVRLLVPIVKRVTMYPCIYVYKCPAGSVLWGSLSNQNRRCKTASALPQGQLPRSPYCR